MKLKSLEVFGFKSFAERQTFALDAGVTAIVGPNGCGKSNVVDAVKWVLGEQRARSLRGNDMTDVIFNGSERRPAMEVAEVTLTFLNDDRVLSIDKDEVAVTRRLYRSGESEYLIDRQSVRLRDVRELFMGTGLGPGGYSFMEQGKIDSVLASNPIERRRVFEEAAGISRFRARRHETELKLDKVDANLLRLADIVDELGRQERSLKIQAGKAERYQEFNQRARELQAQVALHRYSGNARTLAELEGAIAEARVRRDELVQERDRWRTAHEEIGVELHARNGELAARRESAADLAAREKAARELASFHAQNLTTMSERVASHRREIERLRAEVEVNRTDVARLEVEAAGLEADLGRRRDEVAEREAAATALREAARRLEAEAEESERGLHALARRHLELDREAARLDAELARWTDEVARARESLGAMAADRARIEAESAGAGERQAEAEQRLALARSTRDAAAASLDAARGAVERLSDDHRRRVSERSRIAGRAEALEAHISRQEGLDVGVKAVLAERQKRPQFLPGFRGLLLDLFRADLDVADALEAALGEAAQAVVVATVAEAVEGARFLSGGGRGRAAFIPLEVFARASGELPAGVRCDDAAVAPVLAALLGGVEVVSPEEIEARIGAAEVPSLVVTSKGDVLRQGAILVSGQKGAQRGQMAMRAELDQLRSDREAMDLAVGEIEAALDAARGESTSARERVVAADRSVHEAERAHRELGHELDGYRHRLTRLDGERDRLERLSVEADRRSGDARALREGVSAQIVELQERMAEQETRRQEKGGERAESRAALEAAQLSLEERRLALATDAQRLEGLRAGARHAAERQTSAAQAIARYESELTAFAGDSERSAQAVDDEREKAASLGDDLAKRRDEIGAIESEVGVVRGRYDEATRRLREFEAGFSAVADDLHVKEVRVGELRVGQEGLVEKIRDELDLDLVALHAAYEPADADWDAVEAELHELRDRLRKLGNVNLAAIDDLQQVQERLEFLTAQRNDLLHSKQQLARVLGDIEAESTRLFNETFSKVREEFQVIFRKLFGGGRADIVLENPENVLESGIEITARPPGKEMRSITLLSGGERTLTAVSLLFAIIRAHPCPCCLLDEVDAALDEDNTERFCRLLDEFLDRTQFLLITHSRRTMARADTLFGVTMGERGVSRRVGVRFEDVGEDGSITERGDGEGNAEGGRRPRGGGRRAQPAALGGDPESEVAAPSLPLMGEVLVEMASAEADEAGGRVGLIGGGEPTPAARRRATAADAEVEREQEQDAT